MPPLVAALALVIPPATANPPVEDAPLANNNNVGGKPLNVARNVYDVEIKFEDVENYMIGKEKKESLELVQELESK